MKKGDAIRIATFGTSFDGLEGVVIATPVSSTAKVWVEVNGYRMEMDRANLVILPIPCTSDSMVDPELAADIMDGLHEQSPYEAYVADAKANGRGFMGEREWKSHQSTVDGDESFESIERVLQPVITDKMRADADRMAAEYLDYALIRGYEHTHYMLYNFFNDGVWLVNTNGSCNMDDATKLVRVL